MDDIAAWFAEEMIRLEREMYVHTGIRAKRERTDGGGAKSLFRRRKGRDEVVVAWDRPDKATGIRWTLRTTDADGETKKFVEGIFPAKRFYLHGLVAMSSLSEAPPTRLIAPKGRVTLAIFGGTMVLVVFGLLRLIGISLPSAVLLSGADAPPLAQVLQTMQQVTSSLTFGDLPMLVAGTVVNMPAFGLGVLAAISFLLTIHALPLVGVGDDLITGRAIAMLAVTVFCALGSIVLTPFPWNLLTGVIAVILAIGVLAIFTIPAQLNRWGKFARRLETSDVADVENLVSGETDGKRATLGQSAVELAKLTAKLRKDTWKKLDKALTRPFQNAYFSACCLRIALGVEARAAEKERTPSVGWINARINAVVVGFKVREVLFGMLPLATVGAAIALAIAPTPWIAPTCLDQGGKTATVYVLPKRATPAYLDDATRTVVMLPSWNGVTLTAGACQP